MFNKENILLSQPQFDRNAAPNGNQSTVGSFYFNHAKAMDKKKAHD